MLRSDPFYNRDYSPGIIACVAERALLTGLGFCLRNNSGVVARRVRFIGRIIKSNGVVIQEWIEEIPSPKINYFSTRIDSS